MTIQEYESFFDSALGLGLKPEAAFSQAVRSSIGLLCKRSGITVRSSTQKDLAKDFETLYFEYRHQDYSHSEAWERCEGMAKRNIRAGADKRKNHASDSFAGMGNSPPTESSKDGPFEYDQQSRMPRRPEFKRSGRDREYQSEEKRPRESAPTSYGPSDRSRYKEEERRPCTNSSAQSHSYSPYDTASPRHPSHRDTDSDRSFYTDDSYPGGSDTWDHSSGHHFSTPGTSRPAPSFSSFFDGVPLPRSFPSDSSFSDLFDDEMPSFRSFRSPPAFSDFLFDRALPPRPTRGQRDRFREYGTEDRRPHGHNSWEPFSRDQSPPRSYRPRPPTSHPFTQSPPSPPAGVKPKTDLYIVLGISRSASAAEIKKAHRALSMKWHPDRCKDTNKVKSTEKMAEINQANDVLSDPEQRKLYDCTGCLPGFAGR